MLHEIRARVADMEQKDVERNQKAAAEWLEMERKVAAERLEMERNAAAEPPKRLEMEPKSGSGSAGLEQKISAEML